MDFYKRLMTELGHRKSALQSKAADGGAADWGAYQRLVGEHKALTWVEGEAMRIATQMAKEQGE